MQNFIITTADELFTFCENVFKKLLSEQKEKPTAETETLLKPKDVCQLLKISNGTLFSWKREGRIPFRRMGRRIFFVKSDVINAMKQINSERRA